jgi:beta-glucanase (GH16 family)
MINLKSFFLILLLCLNFCFVKAQVSSDYKLVWADEFNTNGAPDPANWTYENGFVRNHEFQWYQPQNARCENGKLIIEAKRVKNPNPWHAAESKDWRKSRDSIHYTSACLITKGLHSWQYGRFVLRARIDINSGLWPAWWTLGLHENWPANGEIDMMEYYRKKLLANIACLGKDNNPEWFSNRFSIDSMGGKKWAEKFHTWQMDWNENFIILYVDGHLLNKVPLDSLVNKDGSGFNPFKQPHYMLLNLAIGGDNGGDPVHTAFPKKFEIDYVRVYQKIN